jgi:hypothetical protein
MDPQSDGLPGGISHNVTVRCSASWPLVPVEDLGPEEDVCDGLELHPPRMWDILDPIPTGGGDAQVFQQSLKHAGGDRFFSPERLHLICILVHPLGLYVSHWRVLLIDLVFYVMVLLLLLLLNRWPLSC